MTKSFQVKTIIYTTQRRRWIHKHFDEIMDTIRTSKAVEVAEIEVRNIESFDKIPTYVNSKGHTKPSWDWFQKAFTDPAKAEGYNVICFHFTRAERKKWGLQESINGTYTRDKDDQFEFWLVADEKQRSSRKQKDASRMMQFTRVFLHELAHGFIHFTSGDRDLVHIADYEWRSIKSLFPRIVTGKQEDWD